MKNPIRRNRNIGTSKQGYSKESTFRIPYDSSDTKLFYESLGEYKKISLEISGHFLTIVIEKTQPDHYYSCTPEDIKRILLQFSKEQLKNLNLIIFRQPKRKERILSSVWGRYIYSYEFENTHSPAIIIESIEKELILKWPKKLSIDRQVELKKLEKDGHKLEFTKRDIRVHVTLESARNTQLFRTLPHELGHHIHYQTFLSQRGMNFYEGFEEFFRKPESEREMFAHRFADQFYKEMLHSQVIPFQRMLNVGWLETKGLEIDDFLE